MAPPVSDPKVISQATHAEQVRFRRLLAIWLRRGSRLALPHARAMPIAIAVFANRRMGCCGAGWSTIWRAYRGSKHCFLFNNIGNSLPKKRLRCGGNGFTTNFAQGMRRGGSTVATILIVDDDMAVQATIRLLLERAGHNVVVVSDDRMAAVADCLDVVNPSAAIVSAGLVAARP